MKKILIPLPTYGFDPTEVAIPWKILSERGFQIIFATPKGTKAAGDTIILTGSGLGIWKKVLKAGTDAVEAYNQLVSSKEFCAPISYDAIMKNQYDVLLLPGGHDKGVKEYLESKILQNTVVDFFRKEKPVAAICHGVVLAARSINPETGKSVLYEYKTTALLRSQELIAFNMTRLWLKDYYLTYPGITVEGEIKSVLKNPLQFVKGPTPMSRDNFQNLKAGFVVKDRNYLSARWPGDAYNFALELIQLLNK